MEKGVYFAKDANYSASSQYSPPGPTGIRHMYLPRVLVGDYTVGNKDIIVPPSGLALLGSTLTSFAILLIFFFACSTLFGESVEKEDDRGH